MDVVYEENDLTKICDELVKSGANKEVIDSVQFKFFLSSLMVRNKCEEVSLEKYYPIGAFVIHMDCKSLFRKEKYFYFSILDRDPDKYDINICKVWKRNDYFALDETEYQEYEPFGKPINISVTKDKARK